MLDWQDFQRTFPKNNATLVSYYHKFNQFWAAHLFVEFCNSVKNVLGLKPDFMNEVKEISNCMHEFSYHPELVTFQELNLKRPDDFLMNFLAPMLKKDKPAKKKIVKKKP